jgi:hypothetical protein
MSHAAHVLPAASGEPDNDVFPFQDRVRLRDNFGFVLQELRKRGSAFRALAKGPWSVFIAIATHFQLHAEAWPGQETIAQFSGCSTRAVRLHVATLERCGFLTLRRSRRADGGGRIFYRPGPVLRRALATFGEDYPKDRPKVLQALAAVPLSDVPTSNHPPAGTAGPLAERLSMEPDQNQKEPSFCEDARAAAETPFEQEEQAIVTREDREVARWALRERMKRKHPRQPPPRWFDRSDVDMVARCSAAVEGDRAAKEQALREAIAGAFCASKEGPPTARFIWEKLEHFFEHVERGRRKLRNEVLAEGHSRRTREDGASASTILRAGIDAGGESTRRNPPTRAELAKTRAEFEEIAAQATPEFRRFLEPIVAQCREDEAKARD